MTYGVILNEVKNLFPGGDPSSRQGGTQDDSNGRI